MYICADQVPKLDLFLNELHASRSQVKAAVMKQPRLLGMSLKGRLVPRVQALRDASIAASWDDHHQVAYDNVNHSTALSLEAPS